MEDFNDSHKKEPPEKIENTSDEQLNSEKDEKQEQSKNAEINPPCGSKEEENDSQGIQTNGNNSSLMNNPSSPSFNTSTSEGRSLPTSISPPRGFNNMRLMNSNSVLQSSPPPALFTSFVPAPRVVTSNKSTFFSNMSTFNYSPLSQKKGEFPNNHLREAFSQAREPECVSFAYNQSMLPIVPEEVGELTHLKELNFSFNKLSNLPDSIAQLTNLLTLNLSENEFSEVPSVVFQLKSLTQLNMSGNQIKKLPFEIGNLTNMVQLHFGNNQLTTLPTSIGKLAQLKILHLQKNFFTALPTTIGRLNSLISLYLQENQLSSIPSEVCQLNSLSTLFLQNNRINKLPPSIGQLSHMWWLNVSNNCLNTFPSSLGRLSKTLTDFLYHGNTLKDIPQFLRDSQDSKALLTYLEREIPPDVIVSSLALPNDMRTMVNSKLFSDLVISVNGTDVYLHKCILYARRSRFSAQNLFPGVEEIDLFEPSAPRPKPIEINFDISLLLDALEFIYTGNVQHICANPTRYKKYLFVDMNVLGLPDDNHFEILSNDLKEIFNNDKFSDISFAVADQLVYAHKTVLCPRCSPMAAMFTSYFQESKQKVIPVHDVAVDIFMEMMEFIYTGNCNISGDNAVDLLVVANLYQLQRLKEMCEKAIESGVDDENRLQLLQFSNIYRAMQLEELCSHAIVKMKETEYSLFCESQEYVKLNDEIKLLIKRKRESRSSYSYFFLDDQEHEDLKKNKFGDGTPSDSKEGPLDFHFEPITKSSSNQHLRVPTVYHHQSSSPTLPLVERLQQEDSEKISPPGTKSLAPWRTLRTRRKKSHTEKEIHLDDVTSSPSNSTFSFCFTAPTTSPTMERKYEKQKNEKDNPDSL